MPSLWATSPFLFFIWKQGLRKLLNCPGCTQTSDPPPPLPEQPRLQVWAPTPGWQLDVGVHTSVIRWLLKKEWRSRCGCQMWRTPCTHALPRLAVGRWSLAGRSAHAGWPRRTLTRKDADPEAILLSLPFSGCRGLRVFHLVCLPQAVSTLEPACCCVPKYTSPTFKTNVCGHCTGGTEIHNYGCKENKMIKHIWGL